MKGITFSKVLESIESLPKEQRESLIEIVRNRLIEEQRDRLAQSIKKAKKEYVRGEVRRGTVDDFMREFSKSGKGKEKESFTFTCAYACRQVNEKTTYS